MPTAVSLLAPAKVNLRLRVLHRRADGFHELDTLFQAVDLCDDLRATRVEAGLSLHVEGADLGDPADNLVYRAGEVFLSATGVAGGVSFLLRKRIPAGGGLGGGSSDAAAALRCMNELYGRPLARPELLTMGGELGSDVPFFLAGAAMARGRGRGELVEALPPLPSRPVLLVLPAEAVETRWAFEALASSRASDPGSVSPRSAAAPSGVATGGEDEGWEGVGAGALNDFEPVITAARPEIGRALEAVVATGPVVGLMSGSGSTVFGVYADDGAAARARGRIERVLPAASVGSCRTLETLPRALDG